MRRSRSLLLASTVALLVWCATETNALQLPVVDGSKFAGLKWTFVRIHYSTYGEDGEEAAKTGFDATAYWARSGLMD